MFNENEPYGMVYKRLQRAYNLGKLAAYCEDEYIGILEQELIGEHVSREIRS